jgi:hypothetical protein
LMDCLARFFIRRVISARDKSSLSVGLTGDDEVCKTLDLPLL